MHNMLVAYLIWRTVLFSLLNIMYYVLWLFAPFSSNNFIFQLFIFKTPNFSFQLNKLTFSWIFLLKLVDLKNFYVEIFLIFTSHERYYCLYCSTFLTLMLIHFILSLKQYKSCHLEIIRFDFQILLFFSFPASMYL